MSLAGRCMKMPILMRRTVAVTLLPTAALLLWMAVVQPITGIYQSQQAWRDEARRLLGFSKSSVAELDQLQQQVAAMRASPLWSKLYRAQRSDAAVTALQADIGGLLTAVQANAQALAPVRSTNVARLIRIGVHLTASMRIDQLQQFIAAAANHQRYLRIEQLTITAPQTQSPTENPLLVVDMDIHGFELPSTQGTTRNAVQRVGMQ